MARRTVKHRAATAALVALNRARSVAAPVVSRARSSRVGQSAARVVQVVAPRGSRRRRAIGGLVRGGSAMAIAQARILPSLIGGYIAGKVERDQRVKHATKVKSEGKAGGALIENPTTRLLAQAAVAAFAASRTQGMVREAICGYAGGIGTLYEMYASPEKDKAGYSSNPMDNYIGSVKAGEAGI